MINPYTRCPRCGGKFEISIHGLDIQVHKTCAVCELNSFIQGSVRRFDVTIVDGDDQYYIVWFGRGTTVSIGTIYGESKGTYKNITFDHQLPFDVTVDTLKLYTTFS